MSEGNILQKTIVELDNIAQNESADAAVYATRILTAIQKRNPDTILLSLQRDGTLYDYYDIYAKYKKQTLPELQEYYKKQIKKLSVIDVLIILHIFGAVNKKSSVEWDDPKPANIYLVNKRQLAEIFGVSQQAIDKWDKEGLPVESRGTRGRENQYSTVRVYNWLLERYKKSNLSELDIERTRLIKAQADKAEMEAAALRSELLPLEVIKMAWQSAFAQVRVRILAIKSDIKTRVPSMDKESLAIIDNVCKEALTELAGSGVPPELRKLVSRYFSSLSAAPDADRE